MTEGCKSDSLAKDIGSKTKTSLVFGTDRQTHPTVINRLVKFLFSKPHRSAQQTVNEWNRMMKKEEDSDTSIMAANPLKAQTRPRLVLYGDKSVFNKPLIYTLNIR